MGYAATWPTCKTFPKTLFFSLLRNVGSRVTLNYLGPREGLFSTGPVRALFEPLFRDSRERMGYVAFPPSFGPSRRQT